MAADNKVGYAVVNIDGSKVEDGILEVIVDQIQDGPDRFEIHLSNVDHKWTQKDVQVGAKVDIKFGYKGGSPKEVISGDVIGAEAIFREKDPATFVVRGYDPLHQATRNKVTKTWLDVKDSDIASEIAGKYGLGTDVEDTKFINPYIIQNNETDLEFLYRRGGRIGYEVDCRDRKLYFKLPNVKSGPDAGEIVLDENLKRAHFNMSTARQAASVHVRAWNMTDKKEVTADASSGDEVDKMGSKIGPDEVGSFGDTKSISVIDPVFSQEEIDVIAKGLFNNMCLEYVTLNGEVQGEQKIQAGSIVNLKEVGSRFTGKYYVTRAIHRYYSGFSAGSGYTVEFQAKRMGCF